MVRHTHAKLQEYTIERKENWKAMLNGMIKSVGDSNEDLTIALEKLCNSKKVPRRWIKLNKSKFENFLKYLRYKIDPKVANQMWEMFSKALEAEKKKEEKKKIPKNTDKTASEEKMEN
ncbi:cell growth-regulating nucleolar protein [Daphnia sinensis]|uniref:Cell growth-regulating nucleolar protein n=1 Tax=Daphnia sinensis TaxID=1820382 RepID=A0AAD5KWB8_9CRUS|nr:cell growth-regulating nucleolar protein [Daphnia sinensis]